VWINESNEGLLDVEDLEGKLKMYSGREVICALSAASNLTGVMTDTHSVSCLIHQYGACVFWDYASCAPYVKIDMNPLVIGDETSLGYKDAIYFSMHKFTGGVGSPGVLVVKKHLFRHSVPHQCGGGTVFFVTPGSHRYFKSHETREEGGTPDIIGSIRAGLAMQLKQRIGVDSIESKERELADFIYNQWSDIPQLHILGPSPRSVPRLPIFSLLFYHPPSGRYLHHNFICLLLSDLFGIQVRGGCSCAGPYAQRLLGIEHLATEYETIIVQDERIQKPHMRVQEFSEREVLRPGMTRLSFTYFMSKETINFIVEAVKLIAIHGWKMLPQYLFNPQSGVFYYHSHHNERKCLSSFAFPQASPVLSHKKDIITPLPSYAETLKFAEDLFQASSNKKINHKLLTSFLNEKAEQLRWFLLPSEAYHYMIGDTDTSIIATTKPPFTPKTYTSISSIKDVPDEIFPKSTPQEYEIKFHNPPKEIFTLSKIAIREYNMIENGDRILVCLSGGKDSLSLLHTLKQYQYFAKAKGVHFELGAVTVDPKSSAYNPRPLIPYLESLKVPYFYEEQAIMEKAANIPQLNSICSFCSRLKRGRLYACARREGYNVLAFGQHLDDLVESFFIFALHNGSLHTMKASYTVRKGDLRVIRPFVYVREKDLYQFAIKHFPIIPENCPACFTAPKERERIKQLLASQELMFPNVFNSLCKAIKPLMAKQVDSDNELDDDDDD
jgi:selenocysteine lyase/cysteine desulfurase/tRNA(Ile)-lysidine synthase TilS/MesJ